MLRCEDQPRKVWQRCRGDRVGGGVLVMIVDKAILAALIATVLGPCLGAGLFLLLAGF